MDGRFSRRLHPTDECLTSRYGPVLNNSIYLTFTGHDSLQTKPQPSPVGAFSFQHFCLHHPPSKSTSGLDPIRGGVLTPGHIRGVPEGVFSGGRDLSIFELAYVQSSKILRRSCLPVNSLKTGHLDCESTIRASKVTRVIHGS
jgi:hypothetical protein